jgi:hypothetical protein
MMLSLKSHHSFLLATHKMVVSLHVFHWFDMFCGEIFPIEKFTWHRWVYGVARRSVRCITKGDNVSNLIEIKLLDVW